MISESKKEKAKQSLTGQILKGDYAVGERFPSGRILASRMEISYVTANNILRELEQEGYLRRIPGVGTFVASSQPQKQDLKSLCAGYFVAVNESVFARFFSSVLNNMPNDGSCFNIPLRMLPGIESVTQQEHVKWMEDVFRKRWDSLVIFGDRHFPFREYARHEHEAGQTNFVFYDDTDLPFEHANRILIDNEKVGYLAGRHFLEKGARKLAVLSLRHLDEVYRRRIGGTINHHGVKILNGLERAYEESGRNFYEQVHVTPYTHKVPVSEICELIRRGYHSFFVMGDVFTAEIYKAAERMKLKIGKDIEILGMNNLKMDDLLNPTLSSVSLNEVQIGKILSEAILNRWHGKTIFVEPEIIYRESSGKPA